MTYVYVLQCYENTVQKAMGVFSRLKDAKLSAKQYAVDLGINLFCKITKCPENKSPNGILVEKID